MKREAALLVGLLLAATFLCSMAVMAQQAAEYSLKDYMPQTVGSKWTMKTTGAQGEETITYEVLAVRDVEGQQALPIVMKTAAGDIRSGTLESVSPDKLVIFGTLFARRGAEAGTEPTTTLYQPAASLPGTWRVGQSEERQLKSSRGDQQVDITLKLELAGVESVTVPKGTFADCLKLVYTTSFGQFQMTRTVWYAKGVGMVKTEQPGRGGGAPRVAELTDYALVPPGSRAPR
jgi:hypothetical protein